MKNSIKKKLIIICAASAMLISAASSALAATSVPATVRPIPNSSASSTSASGISDSDETGSVSGEGNYRATTDYDTDISDESDDSESGVTRPVPTALQTAPEATLNVVSDTEQTADNNKKYVSRGGMIGWLFLSIIINALISFWIGNRFYRLSKKDSHVTTEIRALRRDVEEKFLNSVGGFTEQETDISNANDDYSSSNDGIVMPQRKTAERRTDNDEAFKRWESQMNTRTSRTTRSSGYGNTNSFNEFEQPVRRKKYQPEREEIIEEDIEDEYDDEDKASGLNSVKNKAKEFLGDIFPFKED